jgi:WD40 repeat protein
MKISKRAVAIFTGVTVSIILLVSVYLIASRPEVIDNGIVKLSGTFTDHAAPVWVARFSPDGNLLASGSVDSTVIIRASRTGQVVKLLPHPQGVTNLDFSPDGKLLATSSYDGIVRLWNVDAGTLIKKFRGHSGTLWTLAFSPGGKTLAAAGDEKIIFIWDISSGKLVHQLRGHGLNVWVIKFNPAGSLLASGSFDNEIKLWDVETGAFIKNISGHTEAVVDLAFSQDGQKLVSTSDDKTIKLWQVNTGALIKSLEVPEHVQAVAFSPDEKRLVTGGRDKAMLGELIQNFSGDSELFKGVSARLWDIETGEIIQTFSHHTNDVNDVAYSRDGRWIVMASADHSISLWQVMK